MPVNFSQTEFIKSAPNLNSCPEDIGLEIAFAGRSNSGKSSALNALTNNHKLSRISKTPGRTQMLNFFRLSDNLRLVDLPGYGYAKVPTKIKQKWQLALQDYLQNRQSLRGVIVLMDIRHPLMPADKLMLAWSEYNLPIHILLTKADKFKAGKAKNIFFAVQKQLQAEYPAVTMSLFSAVKKSGVPDLMVIINSWLQNL